MTEHTGPRVTVVVVASPGQEGEDGPLMHCVHSVEQQTYPRDLVDVHIVRNVDADPLTEMRVLGVQKADTPLVAFISPTQTWEPTVLQELVDGLGDSTSTHLFGGTGLGENGTSYGTIMRRDYFLHNANELKPF